MFLRNKQLSGGGGGGGGGGGKDYLYSKEKSYNYCRQSFIFCRSMI